MSVSAVFYSIYIPNFCQIPQKTLGGSQLLVLVGLVDSDGEGDSQSNSYKNSI